MTDAPLTSDDLLPCPFCGHAEPQLGGSEGSGYFVVCGGDSCYAALGEGYDKHMIESHGFASEKEAAEAWNGRVPLPTEQAGDSHGS